MEALLCLPPTFLFVGVSLLVQYLRILLKYIKLTFLEVTLPGKGHNNGDFGFERSTSLGWGVIAWRNLTYRHLNVSKRCCLIDEPNLEGRAMS